MIARERHIRCAKGNPRLSIDIISNSPLGLLRLSIRSFVLILDKVIQVTPGFVRDPHINKTVVAIRMAHQIALQLMNLLA
jgi:hypothetical protein